MSSAVRREQWEHEIGQTTMRRIPPPEDDASRIATANVDAPLRTRDHAAIVYWHPSELLANVIPYLVEGLRAKDKVVYVADETPLATITSELHKRDVDVASAIARGDLVLTTSRDAFFPDGRFNVEAALDGVRSLAAAAATDGYRRVRFSVEMTYLLADVPGMERGPEFESRANAEVFARFPFVCICSFNGARDDSRILKEVLATHPVLIADGIPLVNPHFRKWTA